MEDALSTVVLPAKIFTDQVEDEFCSITRPQKIGPLFKAETGGFSGF